MRQFSLLALSLIFAHAPFSSCEKPATATSQDAIAYNAAVKQYDTVSPTSLLTSAAPTSLVQVTQHQSPITPVLVSGRSSDSQSDQSAGNDPGAVGQETGDFNLSTGGLVAIIVVVVVVVIFGISTTVLYVVAKRRQWKIRESIKRASRRITGRQGKYEREQMQKKRSGMMASEQNASRAPGHKRGLVARTDDVERGPHRDQAPENATQGEKSWVTRLWGSD